MARRILIPLLLFIVSSGCGYLARPVVDQQMATADGKMPAAMQDEPAVKQPAPIRVTQVEIYDPASGKVLMVLGSERGIPAAWIRDGGTTRKIDMAWLSRQLK